MSDIEFEKAIQLCRQNNRICPQPKQWNDLWSLLKNKEKIGTKWVPALPLILSAWWETTAIEKQLRLNEHLKWAEKNNQLVEIIELLTTLREEDWHHIND